MKNSFFAVAARMKYIERWALMRSSRPENLSEHSGEVAMLSHALCTLGNLRFGRSLNADRAAVISLYHDATEIITGDLPTPVKYANETIEKAFHAVEDSAAERLLAELPEDLRAVYEPILSPRSAVSSQEDRYLLKLVKAADKLSAYIKCVDEERAGNAEFSTAAKTLKGSLDAMAAELPELKVFMEEFLPAYGHTLDQLLSPE